MSDYDDYSDYDDFSDQDNHAGAYGGYDDLYDDVIEEAGYDAWNIGDLEFGFDEERYLFELDPFSEYCDLLNSSQNGCTYQSLVQMAELSSQLIAAWKKRSSATVTPKNSSKFTDEVNHLRLNLYQLETKERDELRSFSVWKLLRIFGGEEEVLHFDKKIEQILKFLKKLLMDILGRCLPTCLPYPVLSTIFSHLMASKGLESIGQVSIDDVSVYDKNFGKSNKFEEMMCMGNLYLAMADVYDHLKNIMFNIEPKRKFMYNFEPNTLNFDKSLNERIASLDEKFEHLVNKVTSVKFEKDIEELEIETVDEAGNKFKVTVEDSFND